MFTSRTFILFLVALILAIAAVFIAQRWVESMGGGPVKQAEYSKVVVASKDILQWQTVELAQVHAVDWPKDAVSPDMFTEMDKVIGRVAIDTVFKDEPLNGRRVVDRKGGNVFALRIPENLRAFTVRVNDVSGVGGFLLPDNHVDVIASRKAPGSNDQTVTETIVQDIKVLAVDQEASNDKNKPIVVRSVTLEMTPQQAETVFRADEEGSIQLALRNPVDENPVPVRKAEAEAQSPARVEAPLPVSVPAARSAAPSGRTFTIIRGTYSSKVRCGRFECSESGN
jgi:pilus assembly protein CpaB